MFSGLRVGANVQFKNVTLRCQDLPSDCIQYTFKARAPFRRDRRGDGWSDCFEPFLIRLPSKCVRPCWLENTSRAARLREDELAQRYGVSRHPIRKVLQQLTLEGLLIAKPNCGVTVAAESHEHVPTLLTPMRSSWRSMPCGRRGRSDCRRHALSGGGSFARWRGPLHDNDEQAVLSLDAEFHLLLLRAAGLDDFVLLWQAIYGRMRGIIG